MRSRPPTSSGIVSGFGSGAITWKAVRSSTIPVRSRHCDQGRQGDGIAVTDGPYVETKELLGGFVILEATDMEEAVAIASEWPSLSTQKNATVQIEPVYLRPEGGTPPA